MGQEVTTATHLLQPNLVKGLTFRRLRGGSGQVDHFSSLLHFLTIFLNQLLVRLPLTRNNTVTGYAADWNNHSCIKLTLFV